MKKTTNKLLSLLLALTMIFSCVMPVFGEGTKTVDEVRTEIQALSADAREYTAADRQRVEAIKADYDALSAADQETLDKECSHDGTGQPLGRVLESALWTVWSFDPADNSTTLPDGTYDKSSNPALSSAYSKGKSTSSRQKAWSVKDVTVKDGKATATIAVESGSYTGIMLYGTTYERTGGTNKTSEFANVPIDLNSTFYFNGISSSMPTPIAFSLTTTIEEPAEEQPAEPERIDLTITNNTGMFKAVTAWLEIEDGKTTLVMALSGSGYKELFMGTYEEAVANGDGTADKGNDSWIHGYTNEAGKLEFRIPVEDGVTYMPVVAVSNSYYNKYLDGKNALARAFYPRQMELDREAKTLVTGDYEFSQELTVTNNVKMFKVSGATLDTVGGPNSNNYKVSLVLTMGSDSFDKAYVGRAAEANDKAAVSLGEGKVFALPVKWVEEFGNPETLKNLLEEPFIVSFHSVKNDAWYERQFTVSEKDGTLVIDEVAADYTAVDEALAKVPSDEELANYTDESVQALKDAIAAVERGLTSKDQSKVDAMAKAIEDALSGLVKKDEEAQDEVTYTFVVGGDGQWTKGSGETFVVTVKRSVDDETTFGRFAGVEVDGKTVDPANYEAVAGSVKITLKSAYLETLSAGEHTVTVKFDDGQAETKLTVLAAAGETPVKPDDGKPVDPAKPVDGKETPKTGDSGVMLWAVLGCVSAAGAAVVLGRKKETAR